MHPGQTEADDSKARFVAVIAGHQSGKTCYGPHWLYDRIQENGPGDYIAVSATFPLMGMKMVPEFVYVFDTLLGLGKYKEQKKTFFFHRDDTKVFFGSADNPDSLESATARAAWLDECGQGRFKRAAWDAVRRRLSRYEARALFTTTPYVWGWFKSEIYDRWKDGDPDYDVIQFESIMNPAFPVREYEKLRREYAPWKFDMFCRGIFSRPLGVVYDSFDQDVCKIPRFDIPKEWPRYVGHDFGTSNPAAMFYAQEPSTGYIYAYDEYLPSKSKGYKGRSTAQHVEEFKRLTEGLVVRKRVGGSHQEEGWRGDFSAHGWPIQEPSINDVAQGIDRVYGLHKLNKLFVFNDLQEYLDEKTRYSYELDDKLNPTDKIDDKEKFHLMDAERYILSDFVPQTVTEELEIEVISTMENYGRVRAW